MGILKNFLEFPDTSEKVCYSRIEHKQSENQTMATLEEIKKIIFTSDLNIGEMTILKSLLEVEINFEREQAAKFDINGMGRVHLYQQFKEIRRALVFHGVDITGEPRIAPAVGVMTWVIRKSGDTANRATLHLSGDGQWTIARIEGKERAGVGSINLHAYLKRASVDVTAFGGYNIK